MAKTLSRERVAVAVRTKRGKRTLRAAAKEAGVSHTTLHEMEKQNEVGSDAFATVLEWLGVPADFLMVENGHQVE